MAATFAILILFFMIPTAAFTSWLAERKGYDGGTWLMLGFLFSFIALIAMAGAPVNQAKRIKAPPAIIPPAVTETRSRQVERSTSGEGIVGVLLPLFALILALVAVYFLFLR